MKIIIVGAGISGLTTYLFFTKFLPSDPTNPHQITIYESHRPRASKTALQDADINIASLSASTTIVGGGLGIQPNGMRILRELDQELHDKVVAQGFPIERYTFKNARGWTLSSMRGHDGRNPPECSVMTSREGVWNVLRDAVPDEAIVYRHISGVSNDASGKTMVSFTDGSPDVQADILIGADGVWSKVKEAVLEDKQKYRPVYEGLVGVGGFFDVTVPREILEEKSVVMTFGPNGFFGYGAYSPSDSQMMWWSTYETADVSSNKNIDFEGIRHQLQERHSSWKDPVIRNVINSVKVDSMYPTWTTPELPKWGNGRIFIVGDAAHALQPTSGQGTSQAFEDVQTLTLLLTHYMQSGGRECVVEQNTFISMQNLYYAIRKPRIAALVQHTNKFANQKRNQGFLAEWLMYFFIWLMGKLPMLAMAWFVEFDKWDAHKEVEKALANEKSKVD